MLLLDYIESSKAASKAATDQEFNQRIMNWTWNIDINWDQIVVRHEQTFRNHAVLL